MSTAVLRRIAAVLALALLLWGGLALWRRSARDAAGGLMLPRLPAESVERISFIRGGDTIALARSGITWQVNGQPADAQAVGDFLAASTDSSLRSELVSQSAVSHQRLGLDSGSALHLVVTGGQTPSLDLLVGSRGPNFEGFYARRAGEDAAYLIWGNFAEATTRSADDWRDRRILAIPAADIGSVAVKREAERYLLERGASGWTIKGRAVDSTKAAHFLAQFGDVRASGFPDAAQRSAIVFDPPDREVVIRAVDGSVIAALSLTPSEGGFWVRSAAGVVYRVDPATANRIIPAALDLVGPR